MNEATIDSAAEKYVRLLLESHGVSSIYLQVFKHPCSHWVTEYGVKYGWLEDYGECMGMPWVVINVAADALSDRRLILAHEACHVLQMYHWRTWPEGLQNPAPEHPLEVEAHEFAQREMASVELDQDAEGEACLL